jgi:protein-disulfide isomerase
MPQIEKEYVETGKLKHIFMNLPLAMHQNAFKAAEAGLCAGDQGKFWEMHDRLFENQKALGQEDLVRYAEAVGLDVAKFKSCLDSGKHAAEVNASMAEGQKAAITGTPSFLIGFIETDGKVRAVRKIVGSQPFASFKSVIDELLSSIK